jgi:hypothetical protein
VRHFRGAANRAQALAARYPAQISVVSLVLYMLRRLGFRFAFAGGEVLLRVRLAHPRPPSVVLNRRKTKRPRAAAQRAFETHKYIVAKYINSL